MSRTTTNRVREGGGGERRRGCAYIDRCRRLNRSDRAGNRYIPETFCPHGSSQVQDCGYLAAPAPQARCHDDAASSEHAIKNWAYVDAEQKEVFGGTSSPRATATDKRTQRWREPRVPRQCKASRAGNRSVSLKTSRDERVLVCLVRKLQHATSRGSSDSSSTSSGKYVAYKKRWTAYPTRRRTASRSPTLSNHAPTHLPGPLVPVPADGIAVVNQR